MTRIALKPRHFPWYDYSRYTFSLGLSVGRAHDSFGPFGLRVR